MPEPFTLREWAVDFKKGTVTVAPDVVVTPLDTGTEIVGAVYDGSEWRLLIRLPWVNE